MTPTAHKHDWDEGRIVRLIETTELGGRERGVEYGLYHCECGATELRVRPTPDADPED